MGDIEDDEYQDYYDDYYEILDEKCSADLSDPNDKYSEDLKAQFLTIEEVRPIVDEDVNSLSKELQIPTWLGGMFLRQNNWDSQVVKRAFKQSPLSLLISTNLIPSSGVCYSSDSSDIMSILALFNHCLKHFRRPLLKIKDRNLKADVCSICFCGPSPLETNQKCPLQSARLFGMSCGHLFCLRCWQSYLDIHISGTNNPVMECMDSKCQVRIADDFVFAVLGDLRSAAKYQMSILSEMIEAHPRLRICAGTHCTGVVHALEEPKPRRVTCDNCGTQFCFACGIEYHAPADCETIKLWLQKCREDSGTAKYMAAHTKDCPNCSVLIEKSGGCNHMQCYKCQHQFCWICLGPWKEHPVQFYNCSKYKKTEVEESESERGRAREFLKRYLFYYERCENHERSLRLEEKFCATLQARIHSKMQNHEGTWIDWQYLLSAAETLRKCRYTLKYTYPYAYYPRPSMLQRLPLFEYQQGLLEAEVEDLSWKMAHAEITDKGALLNKMNICEKHRRTLIQEFYLSS